MASVAVVTAARQAAAEPVKRRRKLAAVVDPHVAEVEKLIGDMDLDYILCRDTGHVWTRHNARKIEQDHCYEQTLRCKQCSTVRVRRLSLRGAILDSHYEYPDGYTVRGVGRLTSSDRDAIRLRGVLEA